MPAPKLLAVAALVALALSAFVLGHASIIAV
jgi:hypothetical protein